MKFLYKGRVSEVREEEEIDLDITQEEYDEYLVSGELPRGLGEELRLSILSNSDAGFNIKKID